jgi:streptomycin 6-kinase
MFIPGDFAQTMLELYGDNGRAWLANLPALIAACEQRWSLQVGEALPNLSYNYVAPAWPVDGAELILKAGVVNPELLTEIEALKVYDGRGIARLIDAGPEQGVLLLERLRPGTMLVEVDDDDKATAIAAAVMAQLWRPLPVGHTFPSVAQWASGLAALRPYFGGTTGPFPERLVTQAERLFTDLLASMAEPVLLHGDLHHYNILSARRQPWLAIDPKGVAGERAYEIGAFLRNPTAHLFYRPDAGRILARRVDRLAEMLNLDRQRLIGWGIAQAVLSAWWSVEDHGHGWQPALRCAELLGGL